MKELEQAKRDERVEKLREKASEGNVTAAQILMKMEQLEQLEHKKGCLLDEVRFLKPDGVNNDLTDIPQIDFKRIKRGIEDVLNDLDITEIEGYIRSGSFSSLPEHMVVYVRWMELAHDWYYKFGNKNTIIKSLMAVCKDSDGNAISYYLANKIFGDMLSFFYSDRDFKRNSWYIYLAERLVMGATMAWEVNDFETYGKNMERAGNIISKIAIEKQGIDPRLLERRPRYFFTNAKELGLPDIDRQALGRQIDEFPVPEKVKLRTKRDLGVEQRDLLDDDSLREEIEETK